MDFPKKIKITFLSLAAVFFLAACDTGTEVVAPTSEETTEETSEINEESTSQPTEDQNNEVGEQVDIAHRDFEVTFHDAINQLIEESGGNPVRISRITFEQNEGNFTYNLRGWDGNFHYSIEIDAETGETLNYEEEENSDQLDYINWEDVIVPKDAMQFSLEAANADSATGWTLFVEEENGFPIYEVRIQDGNNQFINGLSADVITGEISEESDEEAL